MGAGPSARATNATPRSRDAERAAADLLEASPPRRRAAAARTPPPSGRRVHAHRAREGERASRIQRGRRAHYLGRRAHPGRRKLPPPPPTTTTTTPATRFKLAERWRAKVARRRAGASPNRRAGAGGAIARPPLSAAEARTVFGARRRRQRRWRGRLRQVADAGQRGRPAIRHRTRRAHGAAHRRRRRDTASAHARAVDALKW